MEAFQVIFREYDEVEQPVTGHFSFDVAKMFGISFINRVVGSSEAYVPAVAEEEAGDADGQ